MCSRVVFYFLLCGFCLPFFQAVAQAPNPEEDEFKFARNLYRDAHDYTSTADLLAEFIRNYPASQNLAEARLMLARSYKNSQRCAAAIGAYETFYQEHPQHLSTAEARRERAACLQQEGRFGAAAAAFREVQNLFSASEFAAQSLLDVGVNYTYAGNLEQGQRAYALVIEDYATQPEAHTARYRLAQLHFAVGQVEAALALLETIAAADPPPSEKPDALLLAGRIHLFLGRLDGAQRLFASLQHNFSTAAQADSAYLEWATYLYQRRQFSRAGEAFATAQKRMGTTQLKQRALLGLANAQRQSGQVQQALEHYRTLLKDLTPDQADYRGAQLGLAIGQGQSGQFTTAVSRFHQLLQDGPTTPEAIASLRELGVLYQRRGDYTPAITWYESYLKAAPAASDAEEVQLALAQVYSTIGYGEQAIDLYRGLVDGGAALMAEAQFGLAGAFVQSSQPQLALREYIVFLERFPAHRRTTEARERIEYLREFTVMNPQALAATRQQAWIDELSGTPRQIVEFEMAQVSYVHHDFANAARLFQHYVVAYIDNAYAPQAQYLLAESLLKLARQRRLEERDSATDSLRLLGLQEHRILARSSAGKWAQKAQIRLLETAAEAAPDSQRYQLLEQGFAQFLDDHGQGDSPHRALALLRLAEARRQLGQDNAATLDAAIQTYGLLLRDFPSDPLVAQALFGLGLGHALKGEYDSAEEHMERVLRDFPGSELAPRVLFELGQIQLRQEQPRQAIARLRELRLAYPAFLQRRTVQLQLADIHFQLGEHAQAIALYQPLLEGREAQDDDRRVLRRLGQAYQRSDQFQAAFDTYQRLLNQATSTTGLDSVYFDQALLLLALERHGEAVRRFLQVRDDFAASPLTTEAAGRAGHALFAQGDYQEALAIYQPLLAANTTAQIYGETVVALFRTKRLEEARKAAKSFAKKFTENDHWPQRFRIEEGQYYLGKKNYQKALDIFEKVEKEGGDQAHVGAYYAATTLWQQNSATPDDELGARAFEAQRRFLKDFGDSAHAADVHFRLGEHYFLTRDYHLAAGRYRHVLEAPGPLPRRQQAIWQLLNSYIKSFEYDAAHQVALRLLRDFPQHPKRRQTQLEIGIILKEQGQYPQAIAHLEEVLEWASGNDASAARYYMGESYMHMGDYRNAIKAFYRVRFHGDGFAAWITSADYKRAECYERLGQYTQAINLFEEIVRREGRTSAQGEGAQKKVDELRQLIRFN